jgi:hypothetical protein
LFFRCVTKSLQPVYEKLDTSFDQPELHELILIFKWDFRANVQGDDNSQKLKHAVGFAVRPSGT